MASLFLFIFVGIALGLGTGLVKHEDWIGFVADIELSILGALAGGMAFVLLTRSPESSLAGFAVSLAAGILLLAVMKPLYRDRKPMKL